MVANNRTMSQIAKKPFFAKSDFLSKIDLPGAELPTDLTSLTRIVRYS